MKKPLTLSPALSALLNGEVMVSLLRLAAWLSFIIINANSRLALTSTDSQQALAIHPRARSPGS